MNDSQNTPKSSRRQTGGAEKQPTPIEVLREARTQLAAGLSDADATSPQFQDSAVRRYRAARREASRQTGLPVATFPEACPWPLEQLLDHTFFPEPDGGQP